METKTLELMVWPLLWSFPTALVLIAGIGLAVIKNLKQKHRKNVFVICGCALMLLGVFLGALISLTPLLAQQMSSSNYFSVVKPVMMISGAIRMLLSVSGLSFLLLAALSG